MNDKFWEALSKHAGFWIIVVMVIAFLGPTGLQNLIDRLIPPPTVAAVDKVSHDLDDWKTETDRKVEQMLSNQRRLIKGVHELNETITDLSAWSLRMEQRVYDLERRKASMPYPTVPGTLRSPGHMLGDPIRSEDRLGTGPFGSAVE